MGPPQGRENTPAASPLPLAPVAGGAKRFVSSLRSGRLIQRPLPKRNSGDSYGKPYGFDLAVSLARDPPLESGADAGVPHGDCILRRRSSAQEAEHREHTAMGLAPLGKAEPKEDLLCVCASTVRSVTKSRAAMA